MKKFRVVRGAVCQHTGKVWNIGLTYNAESAKDAVAQDAKDHKAMDTTLGGLLPPVSVPSVVAVYALVPVPETEWK